MAVHHAVRSRLAGLPAFKGLRISEWKTSFYFTSGFREPVATHSCVASTSHASEHRFEALDGYLIDGIYYYPRGMEEDFYTKTLDRGILL